MKPTTIAGLTLALALVGGVTNAAEGTPDSQMGLSKTSVYDDPSPATFTYRDADPGRSGTLPRAWPDAPPQVPHKMDLFLPLTMERNQCVICHDKPVMIGKKIKGIPTPMSASHYNVVDGKKVRSNARYICTQCHAPQAEVKNLVGSTFDAK